MRRVKPRRRTQAPSAEAPDDSVAAAGLFWARRRPVRGTGGWVLADLIEEADRAAASITATPSIRPMDQHMVSEIGPARPVLLGVGRARLYGFGLADGDRRLDDMSFVYDLSKSEVGIQVHTLTRMLVLIDGRAGGLIVARGSWLPRSGAGAVIAALRRIGRADASNVEE